MSQISAKALKPYEPGRNPLTGYITRDGRKVRILATDLQAESPIATAITMGDGTELLWGFRADGTRGFGADHPSDLMCAPERLTMWVNCYPSAIGTAYLSRQEADRHCSISRIACVEVTFTVGEGL